MGRRRRQKALEEVLARVVAAGIERGRRESFFAILLRIARRLLNREVSDVVRALSEGGVEGAVEAAREASRVSWPQRWRGALEGIFEALAASVMDGNRALPSFSLSNPRMADWLDGYVSELSENLSETSYDNFGRVLREALDEGLSVQDTAERLRERIGDLSQNRAELIASNELHRSQIGATELQVRESGVPIRARIWRTAKDARVRASHKALEGVETGMDEPWPGDLHPGSEIRCRCYIEYAVAFDKLAESA